METGPRVRPATRISGMLLVAVLIPLFACGCSTFRGSAGAPADVPADLAVNDPIVGSVHATGWQVYTCRQDAGKLAWKLKGPDATFDGDFKGKHYLGPKWEAADGSIVGASMVVEHAAPGDAVPWLLLKATTHEGAGTLSGVTYIQRLHTTGGKAPAIGTAKAGDEVRVPYTADYVFYGTEATVSGGTR